jgi:invasion protein IalB
MKSHCKTAFLCVSLTALLACVATNKSIVANTVVDKSLPSLEDTYGVWKVFTVDQSDKKVCYVSSNPVETNGNHHNHRDPYLMVAFFGNGKQEVSISAGYPYKMKSVVAASIDGQQERFIAENENIAWAEKIGSDKQIIKKMLQAGKLMVFSESNIGTYAVDVYSLPNFKEALARAATLCKDN